MARGPDISLYIPEQLNLTSYFLEDNVAQGRGDKVAIYYRDEKYTFNDLCALTNRVGNVLEEFGVEPEDRVTVILGDSPEWAASRYATIKIGGVATWAYSYLQPSDYEYFFNYVRPKVVVVDHVTLERVREGAKNSRYPNALLVAGEPPAKLEKREYNFYDMVKSASDRLETAPTSKDDIAVWLFSGGTTGKPKAVPHMHHDGVIGCESMNYNVHYTEHDLMLNAPKLFFHYAHQLGMDWPFRYGASVVLFPERTTPQIIFELVEKHKCTMLVNVPTMMRAMIQTPEQERRDLSSLRLCLSSGEALSLQLHQEWMRTFGIEVIDGIGSAETYLGYVYNRRGEVVPGSAGRVSALVEVKIVDAEGREVPKGEIGVLMVRSDATGLYYHLLHEKSKQTFVGDDWVYTGDLFREDEEGNFWFAGRADDMIKVSGVWVSPLEIETRLQEHPAIRECVVLGLEDQYGLVQSKAFVALHEGFAASQQLSDELKAFCKQKLAPYKYPRVIEFLPELPKTGPGKIDKRQLRERGL